MPDHLTPFHKQAEDVGTFVLRDRARDAEQSPRFQTAHRAVREH